MKKVFIAVWFCIVPCSRHRPGQQATTPGAGTRSTRSPSCTCCGSRGKAAAPAADLTIARMEIAGSVENREPLALQRPSRNYGKGLLLPRVQERSERDQGQRGLDARSERDGKRVPDGQTPGQVPHLGEQITRRNEGGLEGGSKGRSRCRAQIGDVQGGIKR